MGRRFDAWANKSTISPNRPASRTVCGGRNHKETVRLRKPQTAVRSFSTQKLHSCFLDAYRNAKPVCFNNETIAGLIL